MRSVGFRSECHIDTTAKCLCATWWNNYLAGVIQEGNQKDKGKCLEPVGEAGGEQWWPAAGTLFCSFLSLCIRQRLGVGASDCSVPPSLSTGVLLSLSAVHLLFLFLSFCCALPYSPPTFSSMKGSANDPWADHVELLNLVVAPR